VKIISEQSSGEINWQKKKLPNKKVGIFFLLSKSYNQTLIQRLYIFILGGFYFKFKDKKGILVCVQEVHVFMFS